MAVVIKGTFDDSRRNGLWAIAGFVGFVDQWLDFEHAWRLLLETHEVPYLHMKEMADPNGVYKKWHPPQEHYEEMADFFRDVTKTIGRCGIQGFGAITRTRDLEKFNAEKGLSLQAYPLAAFGALIALWNRHPREPIEIVFDHVEKVQSKLRKTKEYAATDREYAGDFDQVQMIPLNKALTFRDVFALQAADFLVWEYGKTHLDREGWWQQENKPNNWDARWEAFESWMEKRIRGPGNQSWPL